MDPIYCAAIVADRLYDRAKVIVDFGTVSMFEHFDPKLPKHAIGRSYEEALLPRIVLGEVKRNDGLIDIAIEKWDEKSPTIIFTGGYCDYLVKYLKYKPIADKELVLKGVYLCYSFFERRRKCTIKLL